MRSKNRCDIFNDVDLMIIPVNSGSHWSIGFVDFRNEQKRIVYLCSLGHKKTVFMETVKRYLEDEWQDKRK